MPGKFVVKKGPTGKFRFSLLSTNGQVVASSEAYETKRAALSGVASVQKLAAGAKIVDTTVAAVAAPPKPAAKKPAAKPAAKKPAAKKPAARKPAAKKPAARRVRRLEGKERLKSVLLLPLQRCLCHAQFARILKPGTCGSPRSLPLSSIRSAGGTSSARTYFLTV